MQTRPMEKNEGEFCWQYEMSLFGNPHIFLLVAKVLFGTILGIGIVILLPANLIMNGWAEGIRGWLIEIGIMAAIFAVLLVLGYLLYAAIMGGAYVVDFTMDEKELVHRQSAKQAKKAEKIGTAAMIMGAAAHSRGAVSAGYNSAIRMTSTTEFSSVKKVVVNRKRGVIKLRSIGWNEAYADGEDFDFVAEWIRSHIPETAQWVVKS